jgi:serine/threonine protein kinase
VQIFIVEILNRPTAIDYLAKNGKAHCDISFNNILLRDDDDAEAEDNKLEVPNSALGKERPEIAQNIKALGARRGLLIDFDYGSSIGDGTSSKESELRTVRFSLQTCSLSCFTYSWIIQGTMPFMAVALLYGKTEHKPAYDLESLFNVLLVISTHLLVFGDRDKNHGLEWHRETRVSQWFQIESFRTLADLKAGQFMSIESLIFCDITRPFQILLPHFSALFRVLFPPLPEDLRTVSRWQSPATCQDFIQALDGALLDPVIVNDARIRHSSPESCFYAASNRKKRPAAAIDASERPMTRSRSSIQSSACSAQSSLGGSIRN